MSWCEAERDQLAWGTLTQEESEVREVRRKPQEVVTLEKCCLGLRQGVWVKWNPICPCLRTRERDRVPALRQVVSKAASGISSLVEAQLHPLSCEYPVVSVLLLKNIILPH